MDSPATPSVLATLRTVEFRQSLKGYHIDEVDDYLEKAAVEAETLQEQVRQMTERLRQASERLAQMEAERRDGPPAATTSEPAVADDALQRTLLLAQKFVDQTKRESEAEAAEVLSRAEARARELVTEAEERARAMSTEAEQRLREEVTRLEAMRGQLTTDVESMARHLEAERTRLRTSLTEVLKWVDENVQPASSLMGVRREQPRPAPAAAPGPRPAEAPARPAPSAEASGPRPAPVVDTDDEEDDDHGSGGGGEAQVLDLRSSGTDRR